MSLLHTIGDHFWPGVFTIAMAILIIWLFKLIAEDVNG